MVDLVDILVKRAPVESAMHPVMPGILENEEDADLEGHGQDGREGNASRKAEVLRHGVEEPRLSSVAGVLKYDGRNTYQICGSSTVKWLRRTSLAQFHCSLAEGIFCCKNELASSGLPHQAFQDAYILNFVFVESGNAVDDDPRKRAAKVDELVHGKGHDASGKDVILHKCIPGRPHLLEDV